MRQERGRDRRDLFSAPPPGLLPVGWDLGQEPGVISVPRRAGTAQGTAPPARIRQGVHTPAALLLSLLGRQLTACDPRQVGSAERHHATPRTPTGSTTSTTGTACGHRARCQATGHTRLVCPCHASHLTRPARGGLGVGGPGSNGPSHLRSSRPGPAAEPTWPRPRGRTRSCRGCTDHQPRDPRPRGRAGAPPVTTCRVRLTPRLSGHAAPHLSGCCRLRSRGVAAPG